MKTPTKLSIPEYQKLTLAHHEYIGIDIRDTKDFMNGFIPETIHIPINRLDKYLNKVISQKNIIFISADDLTSEELTIIDKLGLEQSLHFLEGGYNAWVNQGESSDLIIDIEVDEFKIDYKFDNNILLLDVRKEEDYTEAHIAGAQNFPVHQLSDIIYISDIDTDKNIYVHCGGGSSSVMVTSFIKREGIHNVYVISEGYKALVDTGAFDIAKTVVESSLPEKEESEEDNVPE